jgi:uncharacterized damage-inducible protein DinB
VETSVRDSVLDHYRRQFVMLYDAMGRANKDAWSAPAPGAKALWQICAHTIETMDFYLSEIPAPEYPWNSRFGVDWEDTSPSRVPSVEEMRAYAQEIEAKYAATLQDKEDADYCGPESVAPWTGARYLGKLFYVIRHTQHHLGEMNARLRIAGLDTVPWK